MYKVLFKLVDEFTLPLFSVISFLSGIYIYFYNVGYGDEYLAILPISYSIFLALLKFTTPLSNKNLFIYSFLLVSFCRYVLHPAITVYLGGYNGRSHLAPLDETYTKAIFLMTYELIVVGVIILFFESRKRDGFNLGTDIKVAFGLKISLGLLALSVLTLIAFPTSIFNISFIVPNSLPFNDETINSGAMFASLFFILSKNILIINLLYFLSEKYNQSNNKKYFYIAIASALIAMLIYSGTNRTDFLVNVVILFIFLYNLFGRIVLKYSFLFSFVIVFIILLITQHREYVNNTSNELELKNDYMQTYFGGVYNVAIGLEIEKNYPEAASSSVLFFDIFRPMIGVNILVKDMDIKYSNIYFNDRMWRHVDRRSQILPMVAQSHLFFGSYGSPILSASFVLLSYYLIWFCTKGIPIEIKFCISLVLFRLGFFFGQNTMNLINDLSMNLFLPILLLILCKFLIKRNYKWER